ncbi:MAG: hypothetical protein GQ564_14330 [Bacteroidales bacterium]|nr:hypothetical protein [Bacteroidales bacterium]
MKPIYKDISIPDHNSRSTVSGAGYIKKSNTLGITFQVAGPIAGAYLGYKSDLIVKQNEDTKKAIPLANAAIGAVVGYSIPFMMNMIGGKNKKSDAIDREKWVRKKFPGYLILDQTSILKFSIIPKSIENQFLVKNIQDVRDFVYLFSRSKYSDNIAMQAIEVLPRYDLPEIIETIKNPLYVKNAKVKYYNLSNTTAELKNAISRYPEARDGLEKCKMINRLTPTGSQEELIYLTQEFSGNPCIGGAYNRIISNIETLDDCLVINEKLQLSDLEDKGIEELFLQKSFELAKNTSHYLKLKQSFPSYSHEIGEAAVSKFNLLGELKTISNEFPSVKLSAEYKAVNSLDTYEDKLEFLTLFKTSKYYAEVTRKVEKEKELRTWLNEIANSYAEEQMKSISLATGINSVGYVESYRRERGYVIVEIKAVWDAKLTSNSSAAWGTFVGMDEETILSMGKPVKPEVVAYFKINSDTKTKISEEYDEVAKECINGLKNRYIAKASLKVVNHLAVKYVEWAVKEGLFDEQYDSYSDETEPSNSNYTQENNSSNNISVKKVEYIGKEKNTLGPDEDKYLVHMSNGSKVYINKLDGGSWHFNNGWNEKNRGNRFYNSQEDIINAIK